MDRMIYQPTEKQIATWAAYTPTDIPSDDWFKANRGRRPWGLVKRDWIINSLKKHPEYQRGIWQGRVDRARGLEYSEERNDNAYNLGYYRGYTDYESDRRGWDQATRERFDATYLAEV